MKRLVVASTVTMLVVAIAAAVALWPRRPAQAPAGMASLPAPCRTLAFEAVDYVVCEIDLRRWSVGLFLDAADGKPFGSLRKFNDAMARTDQRVVLAMNAGMYHEDLSPVGLLVENGRTLAPLNTSDGTGNFFLEPNGVFLLDAVGAAAVMTTTAFAEATPAVSFATQSGPMLVIDGELHPRFEENGASRLIRNGIGVRDPHEVVLAISRSPVSFGSFARLFRDALGCRNALYLDGVVSALSNGKGMVVGGTYPAGPIIAVSGRP